MPTEPQVGMNKIVQVARYSLDDLSGLEIAERPIPQPGAGEVLIRVHLRPINPAGGHVKCFQLSVGVLASGKDLGTSAGAVSPQCSWRDAVAAGQCKGVRSTP